MDGPTITKIKNQHLVVTKNAKVVKLLKNRCVITGKINFIV